MEDINTRLQIFVEEVQSDPTIHQDMVGFMRSLPQYTDLENQGYKLGYPGGSRGIAQAILDDETYPQVKDLMVKHELIIIDITIRSIAEGINWDDIKSSIMDN